MTLEEAINEAELSAMLNEREADKCVRHGGTYYEGKAKACKKIAEEDWQIAEWLKELKAYRETYPYGVDQFNGSDTLFKGLAEDDDGTLPLSDCPWK